MGPHKRLSILSALICRAHKCRRPFQQPGPAVKTALKRLLSDAVLASLRVRPIERLVAFLAWQRRRHLRRRAETRFADAGNYPDAVAAGPFAGMRLPPKSTYLDARFEKTFGAYEPELFPVLERLGADPGRYRSLFNLGAADGYFTVGLARLFPSARILAFEALEGKRAALAETARLNGVEDRLELRGLCLGEDLAALALDLPALAVVDIDGGEETLLDPAAYPVWSSCDLLVETHDAFVPGITETLKARFAATHEIEEIPMRGVDFSTVPLLRGLPMAEVDALVGSERPDLQRWLWMRKK